MDIDKNENSSKLFYKIGKIYEIFLFKSKIALNNYHEALEYYQRAYTILKKGGIAFQIAQCYEALNELKNALDYFIQSAEIRKDDVGIKDKAKQESIANALRLSKELGKESEIPGWMGCKLI